MDRLSQASRWILVASLLLAPLLLAACRAPDTAGLPSPQPPTATPGETPSKSPISTPGESPVETPTPGAPATTEAPSPTPEPSGQRVEGGTLGGVWNLAAMRCGKHPDRFRLVLEMAETRGTIPVVTAVAMLPLFDDALLGFSIWLTSSAAFEVHELTDPVRLAVDVVYP
jgi:hypothetical protein